MDIYEILKELNINYKKYDYDKNAKTCEEITNLLPKDMPGVRTKNLLLKIKKKDEYIMVMVDENKKVDLKKLSKKLQVKNLSFASEAQLKELFDIELGSLSYIAFLNYKKDNFKVIIDKEMWESNEEFDSHPNKLGTVLLLKKEDIIKIFKHAKVFPEYMEFEGK
ncbi:hypothetical protein OSSY52_11620 [Tepiditoga spiralis]|uniref:YbaK/aminoacyl-tRNA synthetase-associated domain-containing protein n=1 Tax=Tepiditoga spiralis TaxID=2108365 RepID=A0A7G1G3X0_9BACT|nr:YbaK/EbsC family protein [Tepiditoga spiralis]BBE31021.1 hypothetical protein OSSY52_11620 [Tepiditoga spiralis]